MEIKYDISIIVPVYNRENLIKPCINSINAQTLDKSRWEVIFVDDASTDRSVELIEELLGKNVNYRIIKREIPSGNASAPRNEGIKASLGKYVFFLDSDDYIDSKLLENGINIALKNDSDIVYFKMELNSRTVTKRPFKHPVVDKADIEKNHLMRTLRIFKLFKVDMLRENNILFDVTVNVYEDMLFGVTALLYAKNISILADRDYYFASLHDEPHLSKKKMTLEKLFHIYFYAIQILYCSNRDINFKIKFYNALLIRCVEHLRDICKKDKINNENLIRIFSFASDLFNIHKEMFELKQIYENEKLLVLLFLSKDFKAFFKLSNGSQVLRDFCQKIEKEFEKEKYFNRAWIYENKIVVLDFVCNDNKIAFDIEINEKTQNVKIWMFCRNDSNFFETYNGNILEKKDGKLLIYSEDKINQSMLNAIKVNIALIVKNIRGF
ncbi:TPA: glycosyltransferase family 2 protein [Campylobacter coli]|nr:glycosyltransferase family 2 protein [Campylobacter coli]EAJ5753409.1 glycosyltransferase family 2 protein [Campylobacter coli]EAJ8233178.1 glycosyltransferase family 2 protein [Campylobacter coli]EAJ8945690.1 glycosyltransferase family 2 protein [Campylobacter coli]ECU4910197.1 glycosyltransferase family 2 protein [Campylobacter coli]